MRLSPSARRIYTTVIPASVRSAVERLVEGPYPRIFDERRIVFIHIPKTAGKSIASVLHRRGALHLTYVEFARLIGPRIDEYFVFAVVRDPVQRFYSAYRYLRSGGNQSREDRLFARRWLSGRTLEEFVLKELDRPEVRGSLFFRPQVDFLVDEIGRLATSHLLRFENLRTEFAALAPRLGLDETLPWLNASRKQQPVDESEDALVRRIAWSYSRDYQMLGYTPPAREASSSLYRPEKR